MELKINMKEYARVKLTKVGIQMLEEERNKNMKMAESCTYNDLYLEYKHDIEEKYSIDEEGYAYLPIYEIMKIFGKRSHICILSENPFEDFILIIDQKD